VKRRRSGEAVAAADGEELSGAEARVRLASSIRLIAGATCRKASAQKVSLKPTLGLERNTRFELATFALVSRMSPGLRRNLGDCRGLVATGFLSATCCASGRFAELACVAAHLAAALVENSSPVHPASFPRKSALRAQSNSQSTSQCPIQRTSCAVLPTLSGTTAELGEPRRIGVRRAVFNVLVGNRDDHLRKHGFIREPTGWRLSPAYDMNPNPFKAEHTLTLDGKSAAPDVATVLKTAELYRLDRSKAEKVIEKLKTATSKWRRFAERLGCPREEVVRMQAVFQT
jgi:hypothetical protein